MQKTLRYTIKNGKIYECELLVNDSELDDMDRYTSSLCLTQSKEVAFVHLYNQEIGKISIRDFLVYDSISSLLDNSLVFLESKGE